DWANTRLMDGVSKTIPLKSKSRLFSSGTQSKPQAKLIALLSRSQCSFSHCPPQGPGSKKGTNRNGRVTACSNALPYRVPVTILGLPFFVVSTQKSIQPSSTFFHLSHTRQSTKNACLYCSDAFCVLLSTPRLLISLRLNRSWISQRGMSK